MKNNTLEQVKSAIRNPFAWPGGYPVYTVMSDGELLCPDCARKEYRQIVQSTKNHYRDGWQAEGTLILWEGSDYCCHCNKELESAYGEND
jgi:hypothetical protein